MQFVTERQTELIRVGGRVEDPEGTTKGCENKTKPERVDDI